MFTRRFPITLGVVMIVLLVGLIVGWVLLAVFGAMQSEEWAGFYWASLSIGSVVYVLLLVGVSLYLGLSVRAINLNRRQSNFIDSVTHELKSPIASMKLYLQTLTRLDVGPEQQAEFHRSMLDDLDRLDRLTNQILEAGRLDTRLKEPPPDLVSLEPVLRDCAETICLRYRVPAETVRLEVEPCVVRARRVDLDLIFRNLIDNAVKYAGRPPVVVVSLRPDPSDKAVVRVADNGRGIPPKLRRKIFGRFVRLGVELERDRPGTGLGLFIVRTLVGRLRGRISVHDADSGSGTVFEVRLPLGHPAEATP